MSFIHPDLSRSAPDRCLRRHGVSNLKALLPTEDGVQTPPHKTFKDYAPGFVHVKEFTDRFCASGQRQPTGAHAFDRVCTDNHIEHRLIKPRTPQTNGMIERFNGRIADILRTHRFDSSASLQATLKRFVYLYNYHVPQKNLHHKTPLQTLQQWYAQQPHLFKKIPRNHPGPDS